MSKLTHVSLALIFILLSSSFQGLLFSQNLSSIDSITTGHIYKFVMYDETEVTGKVISIGPENIKLKNDKGENIILIKDNILYYSTDITGSKYYASISLMGGVSFLTNHHMHSYGGGPQTALHLDASGMFYLSDNKAVKIDAGFTYIKANYDNGIVAPLIYPYYPSIYEGGDISYFLIKGNFLLGTFNPQKNIIAYGSVGFGIHYTLINEIHEQNYYDSAYHSSTISSASDVNAVLSIGGGIAFKLSKQIGIHSELEYNLVTSDNNYYPMHAGKSYFPFRAGIIYFIF